MEHTDTRTHTHTDPLLELLVGAKKGGIQYLAFFCQFLDVENLKKYLTFEGGKKPNILKKCPNNGLVSEKK